jgi:hypothetical protein
MTNGCRVGLGLWFGGHNNWALLGFFPIIFLALLWIKGFGFFNLRFLARMLCAGWRAFCLFADSVLAPPAAARAVFGTFLHQELGAQMYGLRLVPAGWCCWRRVPTLLPLIFAANQVAVL